MHERLVTSSTGQHEGSEARVSDEIAIHDSTVSDVIHDSAPAFVQEHAHYSMQVDDQIVEMGEAHVDDHDLDHQMIDLQQRPFEQVADSLHHVQTIVDQHVPDMQQMVARAAYQKPQVTEATAAQNANTLSPIQQRAPRQAGPLVVGPNTYSCFMKQSANRISRCVPDEELVFKNETEQATMLDSFMYRVITLPTGKTFVIGGCKDVHGAQPIKTTLELVDG